MAAIGLAMFASALDATIVALALPQIAGHFSLSSSIVSATFLFYSIPLTILILPSSSLLKRFNALPLFLASLFGFGAGSVLCGVAGSYLLLLAGRAIQGGFAAVMGTQAFALAASVVYPSERGRAMGIVGTIAPLGGIAGPGIGGALIEAFGWPSIFFVNVPVVLAAASLGALSMKGVRVHGGPPGSNTFGKMGGLLKQPGYFFGLSAFLASVTASVALFYALPFDAEGIHHLPVSNAGLLLLMVPLGMMAGGLTGGILTDRHGPMKFMLTGSALCVAGVLALSAVMMVPASVTDMAWRLLIIGVGLGLFSTPNQTVLIGFGGTEAMAPSSALSNLSARLGTVIAPGAVAGIWANSTGLRHQMEAGITLVAALAVLTLVLSGASAYIVMVRRRENTAEPAAQ